MNDFIKELIENKAEHIEFKKAQFKSCDASMLIENKVRPVNKALSTSIANDTDKVLRRTIIGNTYNWLDSHGDVHVKNTFKKSIDERQDKIWHLHDHIQQRDAQIGKALKVYEKQVMWTDLGVNKVGTTTVVAMDTKILKDYNPMMFTQYKEGDVDQHSVGMYYVKVELAVNDAEEIEEHKVWNEYINDIGNKELAEENGYFWAVKEAKLIEISAVLEGSNTLTPTIEAKDIEPSLEDTQKTEPSLDTQIKEEVVKESTIIINPYLF